MMTRSEQKRLDESMGSKYMTRRAHPVGGTQIIMAGRAEIDGVQGRVSEHLHKMDGVV